MIVSTDLPTLKAIILDFSSVNNIDTTSVQHLIDVRNQLDRYTSPHRVDWHLACINNRWTKRALASAGFGFPSPQNDEGGFERWKPIFSVAEIGGLDSAATAAEHAENEKALRRQRTKDVEAAPGTDAAPGMTSDTKDGITSTTAKGGSNSSPSSSEQDLGKTLGNSKPYSKGGKVAVVQGLNRPLFHVDLTSALTSAVANVQRKEQEGEIKEEVFK